jgi:FAD/FMN-containing dehydrogenase
MKVAEINAELDRLRPSFTGYVLTATNEPGDDYDCARKVHNGLIDKRPACIFRCRTADEVVRAIEFARKHDLEISVRGGGHNVGGRAVTQGGVMIDLSLMNAVTVDPQARTATAGAGATWADFNNATLQHGLATTGGVISSTGVAGLTLGGGLGWLMAQHGMTVDNLISAEVVTADKRVLTASESENPDLFWAIRGGGGNFGVVTSFTFRLHPVRDGVGGLVVHPLDNAPAMLRFFRETTARAPDELTVFGGLLHAADGSGAKVAAMVAYHPDPVEGMKAVAPIKAFGPPVMDALGPMPYGQLNVMLDGGFPKGALNYWKSSFLESLPDDALDTMVAEFRKCPAPLGAMLLEHFHGAVTRIPVDATAYPHRRTGFNLLIAAQWLDPSQTDACIAWARNTYDAMGPFMAEGKYVNYLGDDAAGDAVSQAYGPNHDRLRRVKAKYDPANVFRLNQNIRPA